MYTFHWIKLQVFCYATEKVELIEDTIIKLLGIDSIKETIAIGQYGNTITIVESYLSKQSEFDTIFKNIGEDVRNQIIIGTKDFIDENCTLHLRLDKQLAIQGIYKIVHHGDIIAITGKVQSYPAKKDVAVGIISKYFYRINHSDQSL